MYYRVAYVPGGQAIGALETAFAKLSKRVTKLFTRRRPKGYPAVPELTATAPAE
jgi:lipopolysaccharide export system permease protein